MSPRLVEMATKLGLAYHVMVKRKDMKILELADFAGLATENFDHKVKIPA